MVDWNIHNSDALETLKSFDDGSFDLVITSPPYNLGEGMERKGGLRTGHAKSKWQAATLQNGYNTHSDDMPYPDYVRWQREILEQCWRILANNGAIFYNHKPRVVNGLLRHPLNLIGDLPLRQVIIWDRGSGFNYQSGAYMPMCEWILLLAKPEFRLRDKGASGVGDVWSFPPDGNNPEHPAPFPIDLPLRALETTTANRVLDPFAGSCTTGVACIQLGRSFTGIEIDPYYCELGDARIRRAIGEGVNLPVRSIDSSNRIPTLFDLMEAAA